MDKYRTGVTVMLAVLTLPLAASAQWNSDSLLNLEICDLSGEQILPIIMNTSDGGCFISWFDSRSGSYCVYLQRLNSEGEFQFADDGLLISDHAQQGWLVDYDMTVDQDDNAIIVFSDIRNGGASSLDVFAYKIGSDGSFLWGADGICLSDTTASAFEPDPKVTVTTDGNTLVTWMKSDTGNTLAFQKLSDSGELLWGDYGITVSGADLSRPDVIPAENGCVIVVWKSSTGSYPYQTNLYTQKFDPDGNALWGSSGVLIYDLEAIALWEVPLIFSDENGGAFYTWYDSPSIDEFDVWVQHVNADGNLVFPMNGVQASTNSSDRLHLSPSLSYLPESNELFVFWMEKNGSQTAWGLYGQKISPSGNRLWTDSGMSFVELCDTQISHISSMPADTSIYISYLYGSYSTVAVKAFRINAEGTMFWTPTIVSSETLGHKGSLAMAVNTEYRAFLAWKDERNDSGGIYAQNVNPDGSLGNSSSIDDYTSDSVSSYMLNQNTPNPFSTSTYISYSLSVAGVVELSVYDISGRQVRTLINDNQTAGLKSVVWNGNSSSGNRLSPGLYFIRLRAGNIMQSKCMILL